uniref:DUF6824 domain-containing protein n=1 Tax=Grammatophora oceanica TaxID=210454 RepID=A0A7S1UQ01_9STRA|mmetsp:Transcript_16722/g.24798  ORF Transcript_16722/g.24798 Transcript_16722/m.24798 type:complete len:321 (+) Transcript_16722:61-1023(+)
MLDQYHPDATQPVTVTNLDTVEHPMRLHDAPNDEDVICGRDKAAFEWKGNKEFRRTVWRTLSQYKLADTRLKKSKVVKQVVEEMHNSGRRFLKKDNRSKTWYEIGEDKAREKTAHAFRDAVAANKRKTNRKKGEKTAKASTGEKKAVSTRNTSNAPKRRRHPPPVQPRFRVDEVPTCLPTKEGCSTCQSCGVPTKPSTDWDSMVISLRECPNWCDDINFEEVDDQSCLWYEDEFLSVKSKRVCSTESKVRERDDLQDDPVDWFGMQHRPIAQDDLGIYQCQPDHVVSLSDVASKHMGTRPSSQPDEWCTNFYTYDNAGKW